MQKVKFQYPVPSDGVRYDIPPTQLPPTALSDCSNIVYRRGFVGPRYGIASFASNVGASVIAVRDYGSTRAVIGTSGGTGALVVMTTAGWKKYNAGAWTALTGSLSSSSHGIFRLFPKSGTDYVLGINNGVDTPKSWDTVAAGFSDVGGNPPKPKAMMILANRLMLFNLATATGYTGVTSASAYDVSAFNDFNSGWSTTLNGLLIDTPGDIIGALEMGDLQGAIYKSDAVVMAVAQAGTIPFHFEWKDIGDAGPCNSRCILPIQDGSHIYLGTDAQVYRFDGIETKSLGYSVQKAILKFMDRDLSLLATKAFGMYDRNRNEVYFIFKQEGASTIALGVIISLSNMSVWPIVFAGSSDFTAGGVIQLPGTTIGIRPAFFSTSSGVSLIETDATFTDNGSAYSCGWTHGYTDFGVPDSWKTVGSIHSIVESNNTEDNAHFPGGNTTVGVRVRTINDGGSEGGNVESFQNITPDLGAIPANITDHRITALGFAPEYLTPLGGSLNGSFSHRGCIVTAYVRGER